MVERLILKITRVLEKHKVPYMIIGGQAVLLYGVVRLTEDIDITLGVDIDTLGQIKKLLKGMGLIIPKNTNDDFTRKTNVLIGIDKITKIRVDFIFSFTPYEKQALKRAKKIKLNSHKVNFASCEDVIIHKMFAGRPRDLEDVRILIAKNFQKLNIRYIKKWLKEFVVVSGNRLVKEFERLVKNR